MVSWSITIAAYYRAGHGKEALTLFNQMQGTCILPNQFTLSSLLPACTHLEAVAEVYEEIVRSGFHSEVFVWNALLSGMILGANYRPLDNFKGCPKKDGQIFNIKMVFFLI